MIVTTAVVGGYQPPELPPKSEALSEPSSEISPRRGPLRESFLIFSSCVLSRTVDSFVTRICFCRSRCSSVTLRCNATPCVGCQGTDLPVGDATELTWSLSIPSSSFFWFSSSMALRIGKKSFTFAFHCSYAYGRTRPR